MKNLDKILQDIHRSIENSESIRTIENPSNDFLKRLEDSVQKMASLAKLAKQRKKVGFMTIGFYDYIRSLAAAAQIDLETFLKQFDVERGDKKIAENVNKLAFISKNIGQSQNQTWIQFLITFIKSVDANLVEALQPLRARGLTWGTLDLKMEEDIDLVIHQLDEQNQIVLRKIKNDINRSYQE